MNSRSGKVYIQDIYAGKIAEDDNGYVFSYDPDYISQEKAVPVSLTMPLTDAIYRSGTLFPFFDGLIPEGWLLEVVERNWKISENDRFGLMLVACKDCIGDVHIIPEDEDEMPLL